MTPVTDLAATVMTVLVPFVAKGAEEFAARTGEAAFKKAKELFEALKKRLAGDQDAAEGLERFEKEPERYRAEVEQTLKEKLALDASLAAELRDMLKQTAPYLHIIQELDVGKNVLGLKAKKMAKGQVHVEQRVTEGECVTGAEIDELG